jgi:hypothetical protein
MLIYIMLFKFYYNGLIRGKKKLLHSNSSEIKLLASFVPDSLNGTLKAYISCQQIRVDIKKQMDPTERVQGNMQYQHAIQIKRRLPCVFLINTISIDMFY